MVAGFEEGGLVALIPGTTYRLLGCTPTKASDTGLTHRKNEDLKRYVQGFNCVAVGEIGLVG